MENGVPGRTGNHVQKRVGLEHNNACAHVQNHDHRLGGKIALGLIVK